MIKIRWAGLTAALALLMGLATPALAPAQSVDAFLGFNTLVTGTSANGLPKLGGGLFMNAGGDIIFLPHNLGVGMQVAWRAKQELYAGAVVRPLYYDLNLVWQPVAPGSAIRPDFELGFGAQSLRFYTGTYSCSTFGGCSDYVSSNHLMLHAAVGVKVYITQHIFIRPALDFYNIRHNYEYGVPSAFQPGISIGYTLGPTS